MASGGGSSTGLVGMKRKAAGGRGDMPERREPRRGLGVAALESMTAQLETAKNFYMFPTPLPPPPPPPPPLAPPLIGHSPGVRFNPYVRDEGLQRDYQPYHGAHEYYASDVFARIMQASSGHVVPRQSHQQVDRNVGVVMAAPPLLLEHDHHHQTHTQQYSLLEQAKTWQHVHSLPEHDHHSQTHAPQHPLLEHDHQAQQHSLLEHDHHSQMKAQQYPLLEHDHHRQAQAQQHPPLKHDHHRQTQAHQHPPLEHDHHRQAQTQHPPPMEYDHHQAQAQHHPLQEHDHRHQAHVQHHHGQMRRPQVTIVDLVDSDDEDDARGGKELDLELRL